MSYLLSFLILISIFPINALSPADSNIAYRNRNHCPTSYNPKLEKVVTHCETGETPWKELIGTWDVIRDAYTVSPNLVESVTFSQNFDDSPNILFQALTLNSETHFYQQISGDLSVKEIDDHPISGHFTNGDVWNFNAKNIKASRYGNSIPIDSSDMIPFPQLGLFDNDDIKNRTRAHFEVIYVYDESGELETTLLDIYFFKRKFNTVTNLKSPTVFKLRKVGGS